MTPRIENEARIDVLAVIDRAAAGREWDMNKAAASENIDAAAYAERECRELREARAVVAELIAAASELLDTCQIVVLRNGERNALARFESALIRCGGDA